MQNPLLTRLPEIKALFAPNPHVARRELEISFDLKIRNEPEFIAVEIHQFIFLRATIEIPKNGDGYRLLTAGRDPVSGPDLASLRSILVVDGYVKTKQESMLQLFTSAKKVKNKYPRKGKVRRA